MITIVEPRDYIAKLWGKQQVKENEIYRLMRYVLRVDHDSKVLLHNVVTGQLVVLERNEEKAIRKPQFIYNNDLQSLVNDHYLVPVNYDEHQQVLKLRVILRKLDDSNNHKGIITNYSILPTTACNARCYYCYEHGVKSLTMSEKTAGDVVSFISKHCGAEKKISIQWFGGEPTIASSRINQICKGLRDSGIRFTSTMITNGYLFDHKMIECAKKDWNLKSLQISIDGTEQNNNKIKAFTGNCANPYKRVIHNVGLLINQEIHVGLRMNFDLDNAEDFVPLLEQIMNLYGNNEFLQVYAYPVIGEYVGPNGIISHGNDEWFDKRLFELNSRSRKMGLKKTKRVLPLLSYKGCAAQRDSYIAILPDGNLVKCIEQLKPDKVVGNLHKGIIDYELVKSWKCIADYDKCKLCTYFPECLKPLNCSGKDRCLNSDRHQGGQPKIFGTLSIQNIQYYS